MTETPELKEETTELISKEAYIKDIKARWKIFVVEAKAFIEDVKKLIEFLKPNVVKATVKIKEIYSALKTKFKKDSIN